MTFSWEANIQKVLAHKLYRAQTIAKNDSNPDFKEAHAQEVRDAAQSKFTILNKRVKDDLEKRLQKSMSRRDKLYPKNK